jgi:predicted DCC family thiol-disulfide oxidoreductase YuxK
VPQRADQPVVLLYDGHCSVCHGSARAIGRMDPSQRRVRVVDFRARMVEADGAGIPLSDLEAGLHLIHGDGRVTAGPDAVRDALRALRLGGVAWMLGLPVIGPLFARFYDVFARNRLRWFRRKVPGGNDPCTSGTCRIDHSD